MCQSQYMPYMQMMSLPNMYCPMMEMPHDQLETMYPKVYHIINPHVRDHCDIFHAKYGIMYTPSREQMEKMVDDINRKIEADVDVEINNSMEENKRQIGFGGRRLLRDLISILLIRQLLARRQPYPYPYGGYGWYPGVYGGYPVY